MIKLEYRNREQVRHMDIHKWILSERRGCDLGQEAYFDWIARYAAKFSKWAFTLPDTCIGCGACDSTGECPMPFHEKRLEKLNQTYSVWTS